MLEKFCPSFSILLGNPSLPPSLKSHTQFLRLAVAAQAHTKLVQLILHNLPYKLIENKQAKQQA